MVLVVGCSFRGGLALSDVMKYSARFGMKTDFLLYDTYKTTPGGLQRAYIHGGQTIQTKRGSLERHLEYGAKPSTPHLTFGQE